MDRRYLRCALISKQAMSSTYGDPRHELPTINQDHSMILNF